MQKGQNTDMGGTGHVFMTTHWSMVEAAGALSQERDAELGNLLLGRYWKPVYCFLRRKGHSNEDAKDLTQGFFHEIVLGKNLLNKADAAKGRFRSLLLIALNRYVGDVRDKASAQKRMPHGPLVSLDAAEPPIVPVSLSASDAEDTFHYAWVASLLEQVLASVKQQCCEEDKEIHWCVFRDRVLDPIMDGVAPPTLKDIIGRYGIQNEAKASNMIVTVKRRFQNTLQRSVRDSVVSEDSVSEEWEQIRQFFPGMAQDAP
jgi:hypothetical protein